MQNYKEFTIKDFMLDDAFCRWVIQNSETDNHFWNNWLRENPYQAKNVETAKEIIKKIRAAHEEISESDFFAADCLYWCDAGIAHFVYTTH